MFRLQHWENDLNCHWNWTMKNNASSIELNARTVTVRFVVVFLISRKEVPFIPWNERNQTKSFWLSEHWCGMLMLSIEWSKKVRRRERNKRSFQLWNWQLCYRDNINLLSKHFILCIHQNRSIRLYSTCSVSCLLLDFFSLFSCTSIDCFLFFFLVHVDLPIVQFFCRMTILPTSKIICRFVSSRPAAHHKTNLCSLTFNCLLISTTRKWNGKTYFLTDNFLLVFCTKCKGFYARDSQIHELS